MSDRRPTVRLTLTPAAGFRGDPYQRLRRWLKIGLRVFGWRCTVGALTAAPGSEETERCDTRASANS